METANKATRARVVLVPHANPTGKVRIPTTRLQPTDSGQTQQVATQDEGRTAGRIPSPAYISNLLVGTLLLMEVSRAA